MLIPLGILASSGGAAGSYELIETVSLSSGQSSVTFSSLDTYNTTYQHLQVRASARMSVASNGTTGNLRLNGDTGANYARHYLQGTGSAVQSDAVTSNSYMYNLYAINAANDVSNSFTAIVVDILDPFETTKNTTVRALSGVPGNENRIRLGSGLWMNTASVTSITFISDQGGTSLTFVEEGGANFVQYSRFSLYGIKGA
jgi:hypothetical protein